MAVKGKLHRHERGADRDKEREIAELAAKLAPPEEAGENDRFIDGSIIVKNEDARLPDHVIDESEESGWRIDRLVWVVLILALGFTSCIAYLIASKPVDP